MSSISKVTLFISYSSRFSAIVRCKTINYTFHCFAKLQKAPHFYYFVICNKHTLRTGLNSCIYNNHIVVLWYDSIKIYYSNYCYRHLLQIDKIHISLLLEIATDFSCIALHLFYFLNFQYIYINYTMLYLLH